MQPWPPSACAIPRPAPRLAPVTTTTGVVSDESSDDGATVDSYDLSGDVTGRIRAQERAQRCDVVAGSQAGSGNGLEQMLRRRKCAGGLLLAKHRSIDGEGRQTICRDSLRRVVQSDGFRKRDHAAFSRGIMALSGRAFLTGRRGDRD